MKKKQQAQGYITSQTTNGVALKGFDNHQTQLFAYIQKVSKLVDTRIMCTAIHLC